METISQKKMYVMKVIKHRPDAVIEALREATKGQNDSSDDENKEDRS